MLDTTLKTLEARAIIWQTMQTQTEKSSSTGNNYPEVDQENLKDKQQVAAQMDQPQRAVNVLDE